MILSSANAFRAKNLKWITLPLCLYVNTHFQISPAYLFFISFSGFVFRFYSVFWTSEVLSVQTEIIKEAINTP